MKVGDKVTLSVNSEFYDSEGFDESNPYGISGEVGCVTGPAPLTVDVDWSNGTFNSYRETDLELVVEEDTTAQDAERYRWLRDNAIMFYPSCEGGESKGALLMVTGFGSDDSAQAIDKAIDELRNVQP